MEFERLAVDFGLGSLAAKAVVAAAAGWGGRNRVWRCETKRGVSAVKQFIPELVPENAATAFRIERAAHRGGVPCEGLVPCPRRGHGS